MAITRDIIWYKIGSGAKQLVNSDKPKSEWIQSDSLELGASQRFTYNFDSSR